MSNEASKNEVSLSASDWQRYIETWESSGEKQKTFCSRHKLSYIKFGYWCKKSKKTERANQQKTFQPVHVNPIKLIGHKADPIVEIKCPNDIQVRIHHDIKEEVLKTV